MRVVIIFALLCALSADRTRAEEVPIELVPFLQYTVQNRAEHGLKAVVTDRSDPKFGTIYGGAAEDANVAWVANLTRHWRQHELEVPAESTVRLFKRDVEMPKFPPNSKAYCSLFGGESVVWVVESRKELDPDHILGQLTSGWGRGEKRPERE